MKTSEFISLLRDQKGKNLQIEYHPGKLILPGYHLTEIKNVSIESLDCRGNQHDEKQTIAQFIDGNKSETVLMQTEKAASIFDKVDGVTKINQDAELFIEFGNSEHLTSNYTISNVEISDENLKFQLEVPPTVCKPSLLKNETCCEAACC